MLTLLAGIDLKYSSRLGELLRTGGHQVVIAAGFEGCNRFLERSRADVILVGLRTGEAFPLGLPRPGGGAAFLVLTEPDVDTIPNLPEDVTCIQKPNDPQDLLMALSLHFEQALRAKDREPEPCVR